MRRAYKFRLRPTAGQHLRLQACLDSHRELYNAALQERRDAWRISKTGVSYGDQSGQLRDIRQLRPDVATWSFSSQQATLRRLNKAFSAFFRRVKAGKKAGYPRFKSVDRFDTVEWPKDGDGCRWKPDNNRVYLQGVGNVKATVHRQVEGRVKTIQVRKQGRRWFVILSCDDVPAKPLPETGRSVGVDVGIVDFAVTSEGEHIANPRWGRQASKKLEKAQQTLARKKKGSNNRRAARETVAKQQRKVAATRRHYHYRVVRGLVADNDDLFIEGLTIPNMVRRAKPNPDPDKPREWLPNGAAAKTGLNRSIHDAGWGAFVSILKAKAEEAGRRVIEVDPRHTSDGCELCEYAAKGNRVSQAVFVCQRCGHAAQADEHAARNILRAGLARLAAEQTDAA